MIQNLQYCLCFKILQKKVPYKYTYFMSLFALIKNSLVVFRGNRQRTFLTMLGVIIGIASVIVIMSVGAGAQSLIFSQITSVGSNLIGVLPGYSDDNGPPASIMGIVITSLKHEDALAIRNEVKEIEAITSYVRGIGTAQYLNQKTDTTFVGVTHEYPVVESAQIEKGSFFDEAQGSSITRVVVLGYQTAIDLFGDTDPIGKRIKLKRESFRVAGVMEKRGTEGFQNQDDLVIIPLPTAQKLMLGINHVSMVRARIDDNEPVEPVLEHVRAVLRDRHDIKSSQGDDFSVRATAQALNVLGDITNALKSFLASIAAISLIVGGIGIMNIMLVSVNERTREIGLRKAIGATEGNIQSQFLTEAILLTLAGGMIGIILGAGLSGLVALVAQYLEYDWLYSVSLTAIAIGVGVAGTVGTLFGWYPARKAAKLEPVEALRYE